MPDPARVPLAVVPSLDDLAWDRAKVAALPKPAALALLALASAVQGALAGYLLELAMTENGAAAAPPAEDRLLDAAEAARIANVSLDWFKRRGARLPFARKISRKVVRYSEAGLRRWLAAKRP